MSTGKKYNKDKLFAKISHGATSGVVGKDEYEVLGEVKLSVATTFTTSGTLTVQGRIEYSDSWQTIGTLVSGGDFDTFDIDAYDYVRFNFTVAAGSAGEIAASGFFKASAAGSGAGAVNSFSTIQTDAGTSPVADSSSDTLTLTSSDSSLTITGNSSTDEVDMVVNESNVDHDSLQNFSANEHIDHSTVSISGGGALTGGGTIDGNQTITLDINALTADASPDGAADYVLTYDASAGSHKKVLLDDLPGGGGSGGGGGGGGSGHVTGPASSVDNAIVRFDGTSGKIIQDYTANAPTIDDNGVASFADGSQSGSERIGLAASVGSTNTTAFGNNASAGGQNSLAVGYQSSAAGINATAIGYLANASQNSAFALGGVTTASSTSTIAIGSEATATDTRAVSVGFSADATSNDSIAVGPFATAGTGNYAIAIGGTAEATSQRSIGIGYVVDSKGINGVAIGSNSSNTATDGIVIGAYAVNAFSDSIALGRSATTTASNQLVIGSSSMRMSNVIIGEGDTDGSPAAITIRPTNATGTNVSAASDVTIHAGRGTGTGTGGHLIFQTAEAGSSGSALNSLVTHLEITDDGNVIMANLPTSAAGLPTGALWNNSGVLNIA